MYPEQLVAPMRNDLKSVGFTEFKNTRTSKDNLNNQKGTTLLVINSVLRMCGRRCQARSKVGTSTHE